MIGVGWRMDGREKERHGEIERERDRETERRKAESKKSQKERARQCSKERKVCSNLRVGEWVIRATLPCF